MSDNLPAVPGMSGGSSSGNGFLALSGRTAALATAALFLKEGMHLLKTHMQANANAAMRLSEMCDAAEVEPQFTAMILDASTSLTGVAEASGEMVNAADSVDTDARGFNESHDREYRPGYEASNGSGVKQAKPGFYRRTGRRS
ncbi:MULTISPECIES: conjugal transfer protein TraB [unclassified Streptomyces]|uniref:conjugal transfer protein TraB n=1 Tax=unclassified Streptomyces TaxID=2593676 RepID=UPI002E112C2D|nr:MULTISPECIES: conjugal transfer protein TraB [unclassified Streptomyces]WSP67918.1 conjugal transfer protein TraB [Streptomyces sp. NBC_01240]WSQ63132.1 conjugal transfer protein TraB [Streptomyces sp. NBC_01217]